jgi:DNA-directed RNA polymerase subunit E'/Rpb7
MDKEMDNTNISIESNKNSNSNNLNDINDIYFNIVLVKKICMKSKFLNEKIDDYIYNYIKDKVEGVCIDEGYIKPDSIKILKKSVGMLLGSKFTGDITYTVAYTAQVCNPVIGNVIDCKVKFINKLGILGNNGPISIIVGKQLHKNEDFEFIKVGDIVKVEVIAKKFSLNDKEIKIVAKLWKENDKNNDIDYLSLKKNKKKEELISSDLTPILYENEYQEEDPDNITLDTDENELNEDSTFIDEDEDDLIDSDLEDEDKMDIKLENPDENNLEIDADDIDIDNEKDDDYEESEQEDESSDVDYD